MDFQIGRLLHFRGLVFVIINRESMIIDRVVIIDNNYSGPGESSLASDYTIRLNNTLSVNNRDWIPYTTESGEVGNR